MSFNDPRIRDCENYVLNNKISKDETHIDFNILNERFVTWYFSDEPELATTPSCYVRAIADVKKINKLQTQLQAAQARIKELEQALSEEIEICPSAKANNEEYCFRAKVCSICSNNRYIKELLPPHPKESE